MEDASDDPFSLTDAALANWRQGDLVQHDDLHMYHLAIASRPITPGSQEVADELSDGEPNDLLSVATTVPGFVVVTQTCDLVRSCRDRPYVEVAPLRQVSPEQLKQVEKGERPALAYVPAAAERNLVADLDRTMTLEKAILASLVPVRGMNGDSEIVAFQRALARKRQRFAFPTSFNRAVEALQKRLKKKAGKFNSEEGTHVDALKQIRVTASPYWDAERVTITLWLIKDRDPPKPNWPHWVKEWEALFDQSGGYTLDGPLRLLVLDDMRASEYLTSQRLDLDHLSES